MLGCTDAAVRGGYNSAIPIQFGEVRDGVGEQYLLPGHVDGGPAFEVGHQINGLALSPTARLLPAETLKGHPPLTA